MSKRFLLSLLALPLCQAQAVRSKDVFVASIEKGDTISKQWNLKATSDCKPVIAASPKGDRVFISKIPIGHQSLKIPNLPSHSHIRVQFDLIIKGTWDGNHEQWGPDSWKFGIDGRVPLVNSTFCNHVGHKQQSFPDFIGDSYAANPQFTKALESSTLGYDVQERGKNISADSIYRFDFTLPHTKSSAELNFESKFTDIATEPNNEQWYGLDNIKVSVLTNPEQQSIQWLQSQIDALASKRSTVRHNARLNLIASDESFVKHLKSQLKDNKKHEINDIIALLNDDSYQVRTDTTNKLLAMGADHSTLIEQALHSATEPEIISRLRYILKESKKNGKTSHQSEIARLLRIIDTPQAKELLRTKSLKIK